LHAQLAKLWDLPIERMTIDDIKLEFTFNQKSTLEVANDIPIGQGGRQVEDIFQLLTILVNSLT
jgi:hypothetical protein